jgi:hypothetical protein
VLAILELALLMRRERTGNALGKARLASSAKRCIAASSPCLPGAV